MIAGQAQRYPSEFEGKSALLAMSERLQRAGWLPAGDGTLSVRTGPDTVWITAAGCDKARLTQGELLRVDLRGSQSQVGRNGIPPDDLMLHLRVYMENRTIVSIVHAYPPEAAAWAAEGRPVPAGNSTPAVRRLGPIGVIGMEDAFSAPMLAAKAAATDNGILLQNDGACTWGDSPLAACQKMEALEYSVNIMKRTCCAGCKNAPAGSGCAQCDGCTKGLKGVTPVLRPGDAIPDRKAAGAAPATAPAIEKPVNRGRIPELTITPHRFTDREKQRAEQPAQAASQRPDGPVKHRYSDRAAQKAPERKAAAPQPAAASPAAAPVSVPRAPGVPVTDAPRAGVQAEVVRRLKGKL